MRRAALISTVLAATSVAVPALAAIEACDRVTHTHHGGASDHRDFGSGKVVWVEWWSSEAVSEDVWFADCGTGIAMSLRTWEERITERHVVDRTDRVLDKIASQAEAAPAFFTIERVARDVRRDGADFQIARFDDEFCACAAAYPELRGSKTAFEVSP